jgi:hypothetical protein
VSALDDVWSALRAEAKPVTFDRAREIGRTITQSSGKPVSQWDDWFEKNGLQVIANLNTDSLI